MYIYKNTETKEGIIGDFQKDPPETRRGQPSLGCADKPKVGDVL